MRTERTRMTDAYPITNRFTWAVLRGIDRARMIQPIDAVCFCAIGVIYGGAFWVVAQWVLGA